MDLQDLLVRKESLEFPEVEELGSKVKKESLVAGVLLEGRETQDLLAPKGIEEIRGKR